MRQFHNYPLLGLLGAATCCVAMMSSGVRGADRGAGQLEAVPPLPSRGEPVVLRAQWTNRWETAAPQSPAWKSAQPVTDSRVSPAFTSQADRMRGLRSVERSAAVRQVSASSPITARNAVTARRPLVQFAVHRTQEPAADGTVSVLQPPAAAADRQPALPNNAVVTPNGISSSGQPVRLPTTTYVAPQSAALYGSCGCQTPGTIALPTTASSFPVYRPITSYRPTPAGYFVGQGLIGQPKLYVQRQYLRNFLRYISP